jgi:hypothetical protein
MDNNYNYWVIQNTEEGRAEAESKGFPIGCVSGDGLLMVVDRNSTEDETWVNVASKPAYVTEPMSNFPKLTRDEAHTLVNYVSTSEGSSDGWYFTDEEGE